MSAVAEVLALLERHMPGKLLDERPELPTREEIRRATLPTKDEIRRAAVRAYFKRGRDRNRTTPPQYVLAAIQDAYKQQRCRRAVGRIFGVDGAWIGRLLQRSGMRITRPQRHRIVYRGIVYALGEHGVYRQTKRGKQGIYLHRVIWEERHGPLPEGHCIIFTGPCRTDFSDNNIKCITRAEYWRHLYSCRKLK